SMNLVEAEVTDGALHLAGFSLPLEALGGDADKLPRRIIFGVRPEHLTVVDDGVQPAWSIGGDVTVEENLGAEVLVFFPVDAPPVETDEIVSIREGEDHSLLATDTRAL